MVPPPEQGSLPSCIRRDVGFRAFDAIISADTLRANIGLQGRRIHVMVDGAVAETASGSTTNAFGIVATTEAGAHQIRAEWQRRKWPTLEVQIIPPAVFRPRLAPRPWPAPGAPVEIVAIGRFTDRSSRTRHDVLIEAVRLLVEQGVRVQLSCVGTVPPDDRSRAVLASLRHRASGLPINFLLDVPTTHVNRVRAAHIVWHAGASIGNVSIGLLEAMAAGATPLIVSNHEGLPGFDAIGTRVTDFVELADATKQLLAEACDPEALARRAAAASAYAQTFSIGRFTNLWRNQVVAALG